MRAAALAVLALAPAGIACDGDAAEDPCKSVACINAPPPRCEGDVKISRSASGVCVVANGQALCDYGAEVRQSCADLGRICQGGACVNPPVVPCEGITCFEPPAPDCADNVAQIYASTGTCDPSIPPAGACVYAVDATMDCTLSGTECRAGACIDPADFPCDPNPCDVPPLGTCSGKTPTTRAATGTCTEDAGAATCAYAAQTGAPCQAECYGGACASSLGTPAAAGALVISEIMRNPAGESDAGEWIELHNPGDVAWSLAGCVLSDDGSDSHAIPAESTAVVPARGTLILGRSGAEADNGGGGFVPDYVYADVTLANGADEVVLTCGGVEIDRVGWTDGWPAAPDASMSLSPAQLNAAGNDSAASWCDAPTAYGDRSNKGTPRRANPACP